MSSCKNLREWFIETSSKFKDRIAFISDGEKISYSKFYCDVCRLSNYIKNGNILIDVKNSYLLSVSLFSCFCTNSLAFTFREQNPYQNVNFSQILTDNIVKEIIFSNSKNLPLKSAQILPHSPAIVICSSGTTKEAKPVVLSHKNLCSNVASGKRSYEFPESWVYVNIIPITHAFGLTCDLLAVFFSGSTLVFSNSVLDFLFCLQKYKPDSLNLPPMLANKIFSLIEQNGVQLIASNLKKILIGGSKCPIQLKNNFKKYNINIYGCYGLTECSPCVSVNSELFDNPYSDGRILDCNKIEISSKGEIVISGDNVMLNYYEDFIKGNYCKKIHTNDVGFIKDSYLYVVGRLDNLIILNNGYKIQPEIIEKKISEIYGLESYVFSSDNETLEIKLVTSKKIVLDILELKKVPFKIIYVDKLEKNNLGKLIRTNK